MTGCCAFVDDSKWQRFEYTEPEMGVPFHLKFYAPNEAEAERIVRLAYARIEQLNDIFSDYEPASELNRLCLTPAGQPTKLSPELFAILAQSQTLSRQTVGAFDITAGPAVRLWRVARRQLRLPDDEALKAALSRVGFEKLKLNTETQTATLAINQMQLDLGGIAKGWAVDEVVHILESNGIRRAFVAASGDIRVTGQPLGREGWRIEVRNVDEFGTLYPRTIHLKHQALSTSGDTVQYIEINGRRWSHIVDPRTALGLTHRLQVIVIAKTSTEADSQATALSVLGLEKGKAFADSKHIRALFLNLKNETPQITPSNHWRWQ